MKDNQTKEYMKLIAFALAGYFLLKNFTVVMSVIAMIINTLMPFFLGFMIAFILNKPFMFFRDKVYVKLGGKLGIKKDNKSLRSTLAMVSVYLLFFTFLGMLMAFIIPQLIDSVAVLVQAIPGYSKQLLDWGNEVTGTLINNEEIMKQIQQYATTIIGHLSSFLSTTLPSIITSVSGFVGNVFNVMLSMIISVYFLTSKDTLIYQFQMLMKAHFPKKVYSKVFEVIDLSANTFGNYVVGQVTDALILGTLIFIGMTILRMPYALLISVICAVTNIIPFFGPYIGSVPSAFILLMVDPILAVYFVILILILQQIEGNFIYPKVVGDQVGMPGLFVLFSIIVGGSLFGIFGMIMGVPTFAVIYMLFKQSTKDKLKEKNIPIKKIEG